MESWTSRFAGSVPELYDRLLGPVMFEPYAQDLARRVAAEAGEAVLETACGTGILTRHLRASLPASTRLVATDLNQPMIDHARSKLANKLIEWQAADCGALPFPDASFTSVVNQFGFMFLPDKGKAMDEARRVLRHRGLLAFNVWDSIERNPYARVAQEAINGFFPTNPPTFYRDIPHGFGDPTYWSTLLRDHGFPQPEHTWVSLEAVSTSAYALATGLVRGTPMSSAIEQRGGDFEQIAAAVTEALRKLGGEAPFRSSMRALVVTAWAG